MASSTSDTLLALDFDGVLCDSCGESSLSGWKVRDALCPQWIVHRPVRYTLTHRLFLSLRTDSLQKERDTTERESGGGACRYRRSAG